MRQQNRIQGGGLAIDEEWIPITEGHVGQPAGQINTVFPGVSHGGDAVIVKMAVVGAGNGRPIQQWCDERQTQQDDEE